MRHRQGSVVVLLLALAASCGTHRPPAKAPHAEEIEVAAPDERGMDARPLVKLAEWVRDAHPPIFSLLVSRDGVLVFELYTSSLGRDEAHYLMSVTKSVTSALMGIAMDRHLVGPPETAVADALPPSIFFDEADRARFRSVTIKDLLGMSALDALVPPHRRLPEDVQRQKDFLVSENRARFALTQALLPHPGTDFQYTDVTPMIATGILEYATKTSALEFAEEALFRPMGFRNYEWMHQDASGIDNGAYGLRLRPIDMQKFGILFLRGGTWNGTPLLPKSWVDRSFSPWIRSSPGVRLPNYGWYWWLNRYGPHWEAHVASGWKGQRIAVIPEKGIVVTMTGIVDDEDEGVFFERIMEGYIVPSVDGAHGTPAVPDARLRQPLAALLAEVRGGPLRVKTDVESRMIPSVASKERHHGFAPR